MHVVALKEALDGASLRAREWFEHAAKDIPRADFEARSAARTSPKCGVYAYVAKDGAVLYVGQSKRRIKLRLHDKTSPHAQKPWWTFWSKVRFLPVANETDRLVLELLLIVAYAPLHNRKPAGVPVAALFAA